MEIKLKSGFQEVQRFRQKWLWILMAVAMLPSLFFALRGIIGQVIMGVPMGDKPATDGEVLGIGLVVIGLVVGVVVMMWTARLETSVTRDGIHIRFVPFHIKGVWIKFDEIETYQATQYRPLMEYGGWGIRYGLAGKAYNVFGNKGVRFKMKNGKRLLVGSQRAEEFSGAIDAMRS